MVLEGEGGGILSFELDMHLICNKILGFSPKKSLDAVLFKEDITSKPTIYFHNALQKMILNEHFVLISRCIYFRSKMSCFLNKAPNECFLKQVNICQWDRKINFRLHFLPLFAGIFLVFSKYI